MDNCIHMGHCRSLAGPLGAVGPLQPRAEGGHDVMVLDIVADVGEAGGLLIKEAVLLMVFFSLREDDFLCRLFFFHSGVQMTLLLAISGVILGDGGDDGLPGTPVASFGFNL